MALSPPLEKIKQEIQAYLHHQLEEDHAYDISIFVKDEEQIAILIHLSPLDAPLSSSELQKLQSYLQSAYLPPSYSLKLYSIPDRDTTVLSLFPHTYQGTSQILSLKKIQKRLKKRKYRRIYRKLWGIGLGITGGLALLYGLTRPCSLGGCPQLEQAQEWQEEAWRKVHQSASETVLVTAQSQLQQSIHLLEEIPPWSAYADEARTLRQAYHQQSTQLQLMLTAIAKGNSSQKEITPSPLSVAQWQQIQQQLEDVIATLTPSSPDEPLPLALQEKKAQYQQYLQGVKERLKAETAALNHFQKGTELGKLALSQQSTAQSLEDWQFINATWQEALEQLLFVSEGTTPYAETRQRLQQYTMQKVQVQRKIERESEGKKHYQNALEQAKKAEFFQRKHQWTQAVQSWQNALSSLHKIPQDTRSYQVAASLFPTYQATLKKAENHRQFALKIQNIETYLQQVCNSSETICTYDIQPQLIKVKLTPIYTQKIWQTALQSKTEGNQQIHQGLLHHISSLQESLKSISLNTGKRVDLYHADGRLMMTFEVQK